MTAGTRVALRVAVQGPSRRASISLAHPATARERRRPQPRRSPFLERGDQRRSCCSVSGTCREVAELERRVEACSRRRRNARPRQRLAADLLSSRRLTCVQDVAGRFSARRGDCFWRPAISVRVLKGSVRCARHARGSICVDHRAPAPPLDRRGADIGGFGCTPRSTPVMASASVRVAAVVELRSGSPPKRFPPRSDSSSGTPACDCRPKLMLTCSEGP